jgi:two-component system cell cycle response regulator DivK
MCGSFAVELYPAHSPNMTNALATNNFALHPHRPPVDSGSPRILVVEDHEDTRFMLRTLLEMSGMRVTEAENGPTGVRAAQETCPDLILMDWSLPGIDGLDAIRLIHERDSLHHIPIVMISGHAAPAFQEKAFAAGCCEYLVKPFDFEEMDRVIRRHLILH